MKLREKAYVVPGAAVHWNQKLEAELVVFVRPQEAWIDGADREAILAAIEWRHERNLDKRNEVVGNRGEAGVAHVLLQVRQAVLDREAGAQRMWVPCAVAGVGVEKRARPARNAVAHRAGYGEWPQHGDAVR